MINTYYAYYYEQLNARDQGVYRKLLMCFQNMSEKCQLLGIHDINYVSRMIEIIRRDYPGMFYLRSEYNYSKDALGLNLSFRYYYSRETAMQLERQISNFTEQFRRQIATPDRSVYYRLLAIQMYLQRNVKYDPVVAAGNYGTQEDYTIIGPLIKKMGVCQGIAFTVKLLCDILRIKCIVVAGETRQLGISGKHAWNMVWVDGKSYHMDLTGDLLKEKNAICKDRYFLVDDNLISVNHIWDRSKYPVCRWSDLDYYSLRGMVAYSKPQIQELLYQQICRGEKTISFRCAIPYISDNEILALAQEAAKKFCRNYNRSINEFRRTSLQIDREFKIALIQYSDR